MSARTLAVLALLGFLVLPTLGSAQNLVTNGGFETGDFTGWSRTSPNNDLQVKLSTVSLPAYSGNFYSNFGDLVPVGTLSQTLTTVAGQQYQLNYFLANYGIGNLTTVNEFRVSVGNNVLSDLVNIPYQPFYQAYTFTFVAGGSSTALQFAGYDPPFALFMDGVSVTRVAPVPEPGSVALLIGLATTGAGFLSRRRRQQAKNAA